MDVPCRNVDFGEEDVRAELVVGVLVVERDNPLIGIVNVPASVFSGRINLEFRLYRYHLSHLTPGLSISPASCFGSDPPERATVNRPFLSKASFWALITKPARASTSSVLDAKE